MFYKVNWKIRKTNMFNINNKRINRQINTKMKLMFFKIKQKIKKTNLLNTNNK